MKKDELTSENNCRRCPVAYSRKRSDFDAVNCKRWQMLKLDVSCFGPNCYVFLLFFQFFIRIPDRSIGHSVTQQNAVNVVRVPDWFPWHRDHRGTCFVGGEQIFWRPFRRWKELHKKVCYMKYLPCWFLTSQCNRPGSIYLALVYTTQVNSTFRGRWLASSEVYYSSSATVCSFNAGMIQ